MELDWQCVVATQVKVHEQPAGSWTGRVPNSKQGVRVLILYGTVLRRRTIFFAFLIFCKKYLSVFLFSDLHAYLAEHIPLGFPKL